MLICISCFEDQLFFLDWQRLIFKKGRKCRYKNKGIYNLKYQRGNANVFSDNSNSAKSWFEPHI